MEYGRPNTGWKSKLNNKHNNNTNKMMKFVVRKWTIRYLPFILFPLPKILLKESSIFRDSFLAGHSPCMNYGRIRNKNNYENFVYQWISFISSKKYVIFCVHTTLCWWTNGYIQWSVRILRTLLFELIITNCSLDAQFTYELYELYLMTNYIIKSCLIKY